MATITPDSAAQLVQQGRAMERTVQQAAECLRQRHEPDVDRFAEAATMMARFVRSAVEQQANVVAALTAENTRLRQALDRMTPIIDDDVDTTWFGAHIRQTWRELRGR